MLDMLVTVFAVMCMVMITIFAIAVMLGYIQERSHEAKHKGIVDSLYDAASNVYVAHMDKEPMTTENVLEMLSLLAKRKHVNWAQYYATKNFTGE